MDFAIFLVFYSDWEGVGMGVVVCVDIDMVQSGDDVGVFFRGLVLEGMWDTDFIMGGGANDFFK